MEYIEKARLAVMKQCAFEDGLPIGPYDTHDDLVASLREWAADESKGGGRFNINIESKKAGIKRGIRYYLTCECSGKNRVAWNWKQEKYPHQKNNVSVGSVDRTN